MNFQTDQQKTDFLAAQNRIVRNLAKVLDATHEESERILADIANAQQILVLIWNEIENEVNP